MINYTRKYAPKIESGNWTRARRMKTKIIRLIMAREKQWKSVWTDQATKIRLWLQLQLHRVINCILMSSSNPDCTRQLVCRLHNNDLLHGHARMHARTLREGWHFHQSSWFICYYSYTDSCWIESNRLCFHIIAHLYSILPLDCHTRDADHVQARIAAVGCCVGCCAVVHAADWSCRRTCLIGTFSLVRLVELVIIQ